jgi:hypothetical protein
VADNPLLQASLRTADASAARIDVARANRAPSVTLVAGYGYGGSVGGGGGGLTGYPLATSASVGLHVPLLTGGSSHRKSAKRRPRTAPTHSMPTPSCARHSAASKRAARRVLTALHSHLMDPALLAEFCDEFTRELNRIRMEGGAAISAPMAEVDRLERDMDATIDMMIRLGPGNSTERLSAKVGRLDAR